MKRIILDTNLLLLLVVGLASREYIEKHKRLKEFMASDYDLLISILGQASSLCLTPNTLTETSNLLKRIGEPARSDICRKFEGIINRFDETYIKSKVGTRQDEFMRLGLTDAVLLLLSSDPSMILITTDLGLWLAATKRGLNAMNFNHHRELSLS